MEEPDDWLRFGNSWERPRPEYSIPVNFGGRVVETDDGYSKWIDTKVFLVPVSRANLVHRVHVLVSAFST